MGTKLRYCSQGMVSTPGSDGRVRRRVGNTSVKKCRTNGALPALSRQILNTIRNREEYPGQRLFQMNWLS